ncbi:MAG: cysteine hydrolase [Pseudonocardia sp.]|nr:cysteine hydrolase [Pseudonocardia sp.]
MIRPGLVLVLVDLQRWIVDMALAPITGSQVAAASERLRAAFTAAGAPVVLVRYLRGDGADGGAAAAPNLFVPQVAPRAHDHVVTKHGLDAFEATDLAGHLQGIGADTVVVAGIATEHGVGATIEGAIKAGFDVVVVADATAGGSAERHTVALARAVEAGARACFVDEVLAPTP